jgi:hypothetical protein
MQEDSFSIVVDASASSSRKFFFNGKAYTRMSFVVEHLNKTLSQLKPTQMFYIISFYSGPFPLFRQPVYATPKNIEVRTVPSSSSCPSAHIASYGCVSCRVVSCCVCASSTPWASSTVGVRATPP